MRKLAGASLSAPEETAMKKQFLYILSIRDEPTALISVSLHWSEIDST